MSTKRFLGIIPARGGSKGLPRKNILPLCGKPLIAYSIEAGLGCPLIQQLVVSTEDAEIKAVAQAHGAAVIDRPAEMADDHAPVRDAVVHALRTLSSQGREFDYFVLLQPTSPLRTAAHVTESIELFLASGAKSLVSVAECEHHPYKTGTVRDEHLEPLFDFADLERRRQDLPAAYRTNGAIYILPVREFLAAPCFVMPPARVYRMGARESIDVDSPLDLMLAQLVLEQG